MGLLASAAMVLGASQMASAADLPMKAAPYVAPVWSWTGFYIGAKVGAGWGTTEQTVTGASIINREQLVTSSDALSNFIGSNSTISGLSIPLSQNSRSGFLGGAQAGYNWQTGWAVLGVQADIAGMASRAPPLAWSFSPAPPRATGLRPHPAVSVPLFSTVA
jgi:outer membrane immunogenic protein